MTKKKWKSDSRKISAAVLLAFLCAPLSGRAETIQEFLHAFHANPKRMMERLPSEVDSHGVAHPRGFINEAEVKYKLNARNELRSQIMDRAASLSAPFMALPNAGPKERDRPEILLEPGAPMLVNLQEMQSRGLMGVTAPVVAWSDSYWPKQKGLIGNRYADPAFPNSNNWSSNYGYILAHPAYSIVSWGNPTYINQLSPSEKYDFVMGDTEYTLTRYAWYQGQVAMQKGGIGYWEGICHGWAAAAHMLASFPDRPVYVTAPNGAPVLFYPQDIKALQSMLWANAPPPTRFVGNRCGTSKPSRNEVGRITQPNCFDPNPATWHIDVVNQIGLNRRSFVLDTTFGEIWNFPLVSARYRYFNPRTYEDTDNLSKAVLSLVDWKTDVFRAFRSPQAKYVVGIYMDTTYVVELAPATNHVYDAPTKTTRYVYDLELDENYNVIGGEWYSNAHPDFLWTFDRNSQAMASEDGMLLPDAWYNAGPVPQSWSSYARRASRRGIPLYSFIKKVLEAAGNPVYTGPRDTTPPRQ